MESLVGRSVTLAALLMLVPLAAAGTGAPYGLASYTFLGGDCVPAPAAGDASVIHGITAGATHIAPDSVTVYDLGLRGIGSVGAADDPRDVEGPSDGTDAFVQVPWDGGHFIGAISITDGPGNDLRVVAGPGQDGYCLYGATSATGPFTFIGADHPDDFDGAGGARGFDLADRYVALAGPSVTHVAVLGWDGTDPIVPSFTAPPSSLKGTPVNFIDTSFQLSPRIDAWNWDFGDGTTSTDQHPVHTYALGGTYRVCLTAFAGTDSAAACQDIDIKNSGPRAHFTWTVDPEEPYRMVSFFDNSTDDDSTIVAWEYDFDGLATSSLPDALHEFYCFNRYFAISLTVWDEDGASDTYVEYINLYNEAPKLHIASSQQVQLGSDVTYQVRATDREGHNIELGMLGGPAGSSYDPATSTFSWTAPDFETDQEATFFVRETSWRALADFETVTFHVRDFDAPLENEGTVETTDETIGDDAEAPLDTPQPETDNGSGGGATTPAGETGEGGDSASEAPAELARLDALPDGDAESCGGCVQDGTEAEPAMLHAPAAAPANVTPAVMLVGLAGIVAAFILWKKR